MTLEKRRNFIKEEILKLTQFLEPLRNIWAYEVLNTFPASQSAFKEEWFETLAKLTEKEELALENGESIDYWERSDLKALFQKLQDLEQLPQLETPPPPSYPSWALNKVSGKKQHEIECIVGLLDLLGLKKDDTFIDIGGGKGHLSRILCLYHGLNGISLDTNQHFQDLGLARLKKYPAPKDAGQMTFKNFTFGGDLKEERKLFKEAQGSFGLHTCGPLALHHLDKAREDHRILNFGCCYNKLTPDQASTSQFFKEAKNNFFTKYALTLASRGHTTITLKDYQVKKLVKYKRAALHFFLQEKGHHKGFVTVGSAHPRDYKDSFSHYAIQKLEAMNIVVNASELDSFFKDPKLQTKLDFIYHANMIRWRFGRVLEKLIILDRTLSLLEKDFDAYCFEIFDSHLSPRNIGIIVNPKKKPHTR